MRHHPDGLTTAQRAVEEVVAEHAAAIGPYQYDDLDEPTDPVDGALLSEFVLVMAWVDPVSGESTITRIANETMHAHHEAGLLHMALTMIDGC